MKLVVIGAGGHAKVVVDSAQMSGWEILGFVDDRLEARLFDFPHLGSLSSLNLSQDVKAVIAIGSNQLRQKLVDGLSHRIDWATIIHPKAVVSRYANVYKGTVVFAGAVIQADTSIGQHCIVNTTASIDHDCQIADYCHIAPNAVLAGGVNLEVGVFVGAGSVIIPGRYLGAWAILGAGGVLVSDLESCGTYVGIPAKSAKPK